MNGRPRLRRPLCGVPPSDEPSASRPSRCKPPTRTTTFGETATASSGHLSCCSGDRLAPVRRYLLPSVEFLWSLPSSAVAPYHSHCDCFTSEIGPATTGPFFWPSPHCSPMVYLRESPRRRYSTATVSPSSLFFFFWLFRSKLCVSVLCDCFRRVQATTDHPCHGGRWWWSKLSHHVAVRSGFVA